MRGIMYEAAVLLNTLGGAQVEVGAHVNATMAEVSVHGGLISISLHQGAEVTEVVSELCGIDSGVFPTFPGERLAGNECCGSETRLANLPNMLFKFAVI